MPIQQQLEIREHMLVNASEHRSGEPSIILPTDTWKVGWDACIMALVIYSAVVVPLRVCFPLFHAHGLMLYFEAGIALLFAADVVIAFNTSYYAEGGWVRSRQAIARRYFAGWFWVDAPAAIPIELLEMFMTGAEDRTEPLAMLRELRVLRVFRLVRLLRLLHFDLSTLKEHLEDVFDVNLRLFQLVTHALKLMFIAHVLGCLWFYIAVLETTDGSWASEAAILDGPFGRQYLFSVYWALTTLTTVGYGDITPISDTERMFAIFSLLIGAITFAFMLGDIGVLLSTIDRQSTLVEEELDIIKDYIQWRGMPRELGLRVKRYYMHFYSKRSVFDETRILSHLNAQLQGEVHRAVISDTLGRLPLFAQRGILSPSFISSVFPLLRPLSFIAGELLFRKGDQAHDLLFLLEGEVDALAADTGRPLRRLTPQRELVLDPDDSRPIHSIVHQGTLGEHVLLGIRRQRTHVAHTACEVVYITKPDLARLFLAEPVSSRSFCRAVLRNILRRERLRRLTLRLRVCTLPAGPLRASLRIQSAWQTHCEVVASASDPLYQLIVSREPSLKLGYQLGVALPAFVHQPSAESFDVHHGDPHRGESTTAARAATSALTAHLTEPTQLPTKEPPSPSRGCAASASTATRQHLAVVQDLLRELTKQVGAVAASVGDETMRSSPSLSSTTYGSALHAVQAEGHSSQPALGMGSKVAAPAQRMFVAMGKGMNAGSMRKKPGQH